MLVFSRCPRASTTHCPPKCLRRSWGSVRILLDTQIWLWTLVSPQRIGALARHALADPANELLLSAASAWEIAIKYRLGKLPLPCPPDELVASRLVRDGIVPLAVAHHHAVHVARLPDHHRDPFDRLLVAQAQLERLTIFTADSRLAQYDVACVLV
ncbi:MAG: type II toxin-antitoxin system VapC family toxin [Deltaproteobacteria bacterium]|nr:type II toxin-antitoxin system VapC family toxin [Deltaproteobacteria bacterium]